MAKYKKICAVLAIMIGLSIAFLPPPQGLTVAAMRASGILLWAVVFWILEIIPEYITGLIMCTLWAGTKAVPFDKAFANFSSSSWWILVGAFGLGVAATKCGLLKTNITRNFKAVSADFYRTGFGLIGRGNTCFSADT